MTGYRLYSSILERLASDFRPAGQGLNFLCPFPHKHGQERTPSAFVKIGGRGELVAHCNACGASWKQFVAFVGLPPTEWWPNKGKGGRRVSETPGPKPIPIEHYPYTDAHGELLAVKTRWEPGFIPGRKKDFTWKRPVPAEKSEAVGITKGVECWAIGKDVLGGGTFGIRPANARGVVYFDAEIKTGPQIELDRVSLPLYRYQEILESKVAAPLLVVEGERKADYLFALGFVATTGYAGAGKWRTEWGADFRGRRIVVIPDRSGDMAVEYGQKIAASALYYYAESIRIVEIPVSELKRDGSGGDIVDWLDLQFPGWKKSGEVLRAARSGFVALCQRFPEWVLQKGGVK